MSRAAADVPSVPDFPRVLDAASEESRAREVARRLGIPFVDLWTFRVDPVLFKSVPLEWMLRFEFVPESEENGVLTIVMTDPTDVVRRDPSCSVVHRVLREHLESFLARFVDAHGGRTLPACAPPRINARAVTHSACRNPRPAHPPTELGARQVRHVRLDPTVLS